MSSVDEWKKQKDLLATALELGAAERKRFLAGSDIDPTTRAEIESLLSFNKDASDFLSLPASGFSGDFFDGVGTEHLPANRRLGAYEIIRELGTGGMGAVFLAERRDGKFSRQVAIKMLRREFDTAAIRKNFEREKNILAALAHPHIATLLDTGQTDDGVPYLVMEYVDGLPVDEFCYRNGLDLGSRLKLFNKICDAVAVAHRNLIVHRDIKPSNILVTADGVPKLLDFGISKIIGAESGDGSTTLLGAMTPEYAPPEQIGCQNVTTAADIYSLGIVLYEMLTGSHPFKRGNQTRGELIKAITEEEPTAPSAISNSRSRRSDSGDRAVAPPDSEKCNSPEFKIPNPRLLVGDLDNIILKAIRKTPERRYGSVEQLSDDIWRYIDGKPVEARSATRLYRLGKFYRRNKIAVTAGLLIFAALIGGISVALWQTRVARANAAAAIIESDNAKAEKEKAEKVSEFMMKIVRYANPRWYAEGYKLKGEARVIDALDDMASRLDNEFADQPDVLAELHHQFGDAYLSRGEPRGREKARSHFERAFELRRRQFGDWHELVAKDMAYLYWVRERPHSESDLQMLADAIVMMRATNPRNLNLPYMLEEYFHGLLGESMSEDPEMFLRHTPGGAPNDRYLAAEHLFDEMLGLLRLHFEENSYQVVNQKCVGMGFKLKIGRPAQADEFHVACAKANQELISAGSPSSKWQNLLNAYERAR